MENPCSRDETLSAGRDRGALRIAGLSFVRGGMTDKTPPPGLDDLAARVNKARGRTEERDGTGMLGAGLPKSATGLAFRVGTELVAGVAVGGAIGYGLDKWLGTSPFLLILMFFLGAAGGMMNVWRAAVGQGLSVGYTQKSDDGSKDERKDDADESRSDDTKREG